MDRPDFPAARTALNALATGHRGQHRCPVDSRYWRPNESCTVLANVAEVLEGLLLAEVATASLTSAPHEAVHDSDVIEDVARTTFGYVDWSDLPDAEREAARLQTRLGLEEFCRLLDVKRAAS